MIAGLLGAVRLLTVIPAGGAEGGRPVRFFPLVGWLFAGLWLLLAQAAEVIGANAGAGALLSAALMVLASGLLSGFLHWDGLADCADGLGVRGDAARRLEVMRSSTVGAFGVAAIVFAALVQTAAIAVILESGTLWGLAAAPVLGRLGATLALGLRDPARPDGLGARYASRLPVTAVLAAALLVLPLLGWRPESYPTLAVATAAGLAVALFAPEPFVRRLGGVTGDVAGATILLTETAVLVMAAFAGGPL
ncbi:MAG: adenosylcobinamide-GDP ribazoletransferase [Coriobacteriia bacterium]|nr:adenosylcobinamide-GDP ribazoletransferase [Coriobacteriia bacterium]